jgi:hypothetical protein
MRKLGSTHSIFFLASTEILGYITAATGITAPISPRKTSSIGLLRRHWLNYVPTHHSGPIKDSTSMIAMHGLGGLQARSDVPLETSHKIFEREGVAYSGRSLRSGHIDQRHGQSNQLDSSRRFRGDMRSLVWTIRIPQGCRRSRRGR